jgi:hypothetical protein
MSECERCRGGTYAPHPGGTFCYDCGTEFGAEYTSATASGSCDLCVSTHYKDDDGLCIKKPDGVEKGVAPTDLRSMKTKEGVYRFTDTSRTVYACPYSSNCLGGSILNGSRCRPGSWGPLCFACEPGFHLASVPTTGSGSIGGEDDHRCVECSDIRYGWTGLLAVGGIGLVGGALAYALKDQLPEIYNRHKERINHVLELLTALFMTMQVCGCVSALLLLPTSCHQRTTITITTTITTIVNVAITTTITITTTVTITISITYDVPRPL